MHLVNVKIGHMAKFCRHSGSTGQKQVKNGQKNIKICLFWPDFDLILPLKFECRQNLVIWLILTLVMFIWMENVWLELWQFHWKLFSILNSVVWIPLGKMTRIILDLENVWDIIIFAYQGAFLIKDKQCLSMRDTDCKDEKVSIFGDLLKCPWSAQRPRKFFYW